MEDDEDESSEDEDFDTDHGEMLAGSSDDESDDDDGAAGGSAELITQGVSGVPMGPLCTPLRTPGTLPRPSITH